MGSAGLVADGVGVGVEVGVPVGVGVAVTGAGVGSGVCHGSRSARTPAAAAAEATTRTAPTRRVAGRRRRAGEVVRGREAMEEGSVAQRYGKGARRAVIGWGKWVRGELGGCSRGGDERHVNVALSHYREWSTSFMHEAVATKHRPCGTRCLLSYSTEP